MSVSYTTYSIGEGASVAPDAYLIVGLPVRGSEHYGRVRMLSYDGPRCRRFETLEPCPGGGSIAAHYLARDGDVARCVNCNLVVNPIANPSLEVSLDSLPNGDMVARVAPYDHASQGVGCHTREEAAALATSYLEAIVDAAGPGPWYALDSEHPDVLFSHEIRVVSTSAWTPPKDPADVYGERAYAGPFDNMLAARAAVLTYERFGPSESAGWTTFAQPTPPAYDHEEIENGPIPF